MHRYLRLGAALLAIMMAAPLSAQLAPLGAPKGTLRFDIRGMFQSADRRIFDGNTEDYLADFGRGTSVRDKLPSLASADALIADIVGQPNYQLNLGVQRANGQLTVGTGTIGVALGITRRITLFANVPFVTTRVQAHRGIDPASSDGGVNPAHPTFGTPAAQAAADAFFTAFTNALGALDTRIANGTYSGDPGLAAIANAISARGAALQNDLFTLTRDAAASPFVPTAGSATGREIIAVIRGLQDTLSNTLGVTGTGFTADPVLADARLNDAEFADYLSSTGDTTTVVPLPEAKISRMGDMDIGAIFTVINRFDQPGRRLGGFRLAVTGLVRLPTGQRDDPNNLLDVGTGNGRYEVGVSGTADVGAGRIGTRLEGGYLLRLAALRVRRVAPLDDPFAPAQLANINENAGDVLSLGARPFFRLAPGIAVHGLMDYYRIGADAAEYNRPSDVIPGVSASVLAEGQRTALAVGGGITYVGRAAHDCEPGRKCGWPIEAAWNYSTVVRATGGRVTKFRTTRLEIRWYQRLWR